MARSLRLDTRRDLEDRKDVDRRRTTVRLLAETERQNVKEQLRQNTDRAVERDIRSANVFRR
jgi:hypothetical protein